MCPQYSWCNPSVGPQPACSVAFQGHRGLGSGWSFRSCPCPSTGLAGFPRDMWVAAGQCESNGSITRSAAACPQGLLLMYRVAANQGRHVPGPHLFVSPPCGAVLWASGTFTLLPCCAVDRTWGLKHTPSRCASKCDTGHTVNCTRLQG